MSNSEPLSNVSRIGQTPAPSNVNLPNALTVLRLILVPVFIVFMALGTTVTQWVALAVFVVASYTDHLDGQIARKRNIVTNFGRLADPIADKALTLGAFIMLSVANLLPWWFTVVIALRELGVTALRAVLVRRGVVVAANAAGKMKTVSQMALVVFLLVPWGQPELDPGQGGIPLGVTWVGLVLAALVLGLTIYSGVIYVTEGIKLWRESAPVEDIADSGATMAPRSAHDVPHDARSASKHGGAHVDYAQPQDEPDDRESQTPLDETQTGSDTTSQS